MAVNEDLKLTIKEQRRIIKFAEGVDPADPEAVPFEVLNYTQVYTGEEARKKLETLTKGGVVHAIT